MDTIAAISTIQAPSAIGILRITGPETVTVINTVFLPKDGKKMAEHVTRSMVFGNLLDKEGRIIDECLCVWFKGPNSYTGEDSAEIQTHGSPIVLQEGLQALFASGARQAKGGEFTKRGFLNGRMDLTQAEAVIDLIEADSAEAARNAVAQVNGVLKNQIDEIYNPLMDVTSRFYALVDYPDEDIEDLQMEQLKDTVQKAKEKLTNLLATFERGKVLRSGVPTAIIGKPNAGKSSLLNLLLGYERAIVTAIPGTTRDTVEEKAVVGGVLLRLIDTAGLRETNDQVEKLGVERSKKAVEQADLIFAVVDSTEPSSQEEWEELEEMTRGKKWILIQSKCDLIKEPVLPAFEFITNPPKAIVSLSNVTGEGLSNLETIVHEMFPSGSIKTGSILTNARQEAAGRQAERAMEKAIQAMNAGLTADAILTDTEEAMSSLGELIGKNIREDLVNTIFSRFCVGK